MKNATRIFLLSALCLGNSGAAWGSIGLAMRFGEIIIENVEIGRSYNLREATRVPFVVENKGNEATDIVVEIMMPSKKELSPEYGPLTDPSWFKVVPQRMKVGPASIGFFDLFLTIPDDQSLNGKHYQAVILARTEGAGMLGVGAKNKIRFSIGPGPESIKEEKKRKAMQQVDFDVTPREIYIKDVPVGVSYDVRGEQKKVIRIANYAGDELSVQFNAERWDTNLRLPEGYEPIPDPSWVVFKSSNVKVDAESIGQAQLIINIPDDAQYSEKKYAVLVRTGLITGFWLDAPVYVYLETKKR